ncbi:MAG: acyl-CoA thioester hydrolase/BAAT C-terminal domain-containing protein [Gammaproteobacteria bacterium]
MSNRNTTFVLASVIVPLLITAVIVVLFLLPTPKSGVAATVSTAKPTAPDTNRLGPPSDFSTPAVLAATPPANLWKGWTYGHSVTLAAAPASALEDRPVNIRVSGLEPGEPVTLRTNMQDMKNRAWSAQATFVADKSGIVDVAHAAPRYGSYSGVHAMGLVWAMVPESAANPQNVLWIPKSNPKSHSYRIELQALSDGRVLASRTLERYAWRASNVKETRVNTNGLVGMLFRPRSPGPHPAIIVLGGSEGGLHPQVDEAALFASHGYIALGLAYFQGYGNTDLSLANLPKQLVDIRLEDFHKAADWIKRQPGVDAKHVAIMGWSKGAEAALVAAATWPKDFQAVIGFMPSSVVWAGLQYGPASSSWTLHGKPLPYVSFVANPAMFKKGKPIAFVSAYAAGLKNKDAVEKAAISVEHIAGPVLLIAANDDQIWPSCLMAQQVMQRLQAHHHAYADQSLCYQGAGHIILPPYRPTNSNAAALPGGGSILFGGDPIAYAFADRNAWSKILAFLQTASH